MKELIQLILREYRKARATSAFSADNEVYQVFKNLKSKIEGLDCIKSNGDLIVKFSCGQGNWAAIPWLAILDGRDTTSTQRGTYIALLFGENGEGCHLKLAQGVTDLKNELGLSSAITQLKNQAAEIRSLFSANDYLDFDTAGDPRLDQTNNTARLYEASTILSKYWSVNSVPADEIIASDISTLTKCYEKYIQNKGALFPDDDSPDDFNDSKKIWAIAVGENGRLWNEFYQEGIVGIGWETLGNLSSYKTQDEIAKNSFQIEKMSDHSL